MSSHLTMDDPASPGYVPPGSNPDEHRPPTFNELLIHEVRAHPELYDQQHRVCTDNGERNLIWENIAASIDDTVTGEFAKKRWLQMRDRYRKELKSSIRSRTIPKWPYYSKLSWLEPFLKENKPGAISASFIGHGFPSFDASEAALGEQNKLIDFSNYAAASTLFENIMAASGNFGQLGDCKPTLLSGEFSPDSAVASTSEDGDQRNFQPSSSMERPDSGDGGGLLNPYNSTAGLLVKLEAINAAAAAATNDNQLDTKLLNAIRGVTAATSPPSMPSMALRSSSLVSNASGTSSSTNTNARTRNPPYLVRRGGGLKVKPTSNNNKDLRKIVTPSRDTLGQVSPSRSVSESSTSDTSSTRNATMTNAQKIDAIEAAFAAKEWANDEDMLFARLVVVRLKKFASKERRGIRARISELIDEKEEEIEVVKKMMPPIMPSVPTTTQ